MPSRLASSYHTDQFYGLSTGAIGTWMKINISKVKGSVYRIKGDEEKLLEWKRRAGWMGAGAEGQASCCHHPTHNEQSRRGPSSQSVSSSRAVEVRNFGGTIWCGSYLNVLGSLLTKHLVLLTTPLKTYLAHLLIYWSPARYFKTMLLWCEDVLYVPDPPFLFERGSGNETNCFLSQCIWLQ